jgi:hypothetical protein
MRGMSRRPKDWMVEATGRTFGARSPAPDVEWHEPFGLVENAELALAQRQHLVASKLREHLWENQIRQESASTELGWHEDRLGRVLRGEEWLTLLEHAVLAYKTGIPRLFVGLPEPFEPMDVPFLTAPEARELHGRTSDGGRS